MTGKAEQRLAMSLVEKDGLEDVGARLSEATAADFFALLKRHLESASTKAE